MDTFLSKTILPKFRAPRPPTAAKSSLPSTQRSPMASISVNGLSRCLLDLNQMDPREFLATADLNALAK